MKLASGVRKQNGMHGAKIPRMHNVYCVWRNRSRSLKPTRKVHYIYATCLYFTELIVVLNLWRGTWRLTVVVYEIQLLLHAIDC